MTMADTRRSPLIADYLHRLELAAERLPPDQRTELVEVIREHLDSALEDVGPDDQAHVRAALDRLGTPEEIVAAAADGEPPAGRASRSTAGDPGPSRPGVGALELVTVVLLAIGGVVVLFLAPIATVAYLLTQAR